MLVNEFELSLENAHFWGMDEWVIGEREVGLDHPLGFARTDLELCFNRIDKKFAMPPENIHFPSVAGLEAYSQSFRDVRCVIMQGGQGEVKHWAFNDPVKREGRWIDHPPSPEDTGGPDPDRRPSPMTIIQTPGRRGAEWSAKSRAGPSRSAPWKLGWPKRSRSGISACMTTPSAEADRLHDLEKDPGLGGPDVSAGRPPERPVQLLPRRDRQLRRGHALRRTGT